MEFKTFLVAYLSLMTCISILSIVVSPKPNAKNEIALSKHFSVHWMGYTGPAGGPDYYICINNLKETTLLMNIALQIKNQELSGYWFRIQQNSTPPIGWTLPVMNVGYIGIDQTWNGIYSPYRIRPVSISEGRLTESINIDVEAYVDGTYTNLYSQDNFTVTFHFINRTADVWTTLYHYTFDDGTQQGWGASGVTTNLYRSYPYSLYVSGSGHLAFSKSFAISTTYQEAYLIFSIRSEGWSDMGIYLDSVQYFLFDTSPQTNTWYQFTIPLPTAPPEITNVAIYASFWATAYLDDVFVIAK